MSDVRLIAERPEPGSPRPWHFPAFQRREVAGGRLLACDLPGRPLASVSFVAPAGAMAEAAGQEGLARLVARALSEGTERLDAYQFGVESERLGASWRASTDWDSLRCGFEVPADHIVDAAKLLAEAVRTPALSDDIANRVRDERVDEIQLELSQPGPRAAAAFTNAIFTEASRYHRPDGGVTQSVAGLRPDDLRRFHAATLGPDTSTAIVVGDLANVDLDALGEVLFGGWSSSAGTSTEPTVQPRGSGRRVIVVDRPGSVQSMLYVGHDAFSRTVADYVPATTMAMVLGGMFNSRLNYRLREDKGYAYGAFGSFDTRRDGGVMVARSAVQTEVTAPALSDVVQEITTLHDLGVKPDELEQARSYRAGVFPISFAGAGAVASGLGDVVIYGHSDDHFDRLRQQVLDVSLDEVNAAAAARLRPADLVCVVVGDAAKVTDDVRDTGIGPVEVVSDDA